MNLQFLRVGTHEYEHWSHGKRVFTFLQRLCHFTSRSGTRGSSCDSTTSSAFSIVISRSDTQAPLYSCFPHPCVHFFTKCGTCPASGAGDATANQETVLLGEVCLRSKWRMVVVAAMMTALYYAVGVFCLLLLCVSVLGMEPEHCTCGANALPWSSTPPCCSLYTLNYLFLKDP
jgi:hypothetical protein